MLKKVFGISVLLLLLLSSTAFAVKNVKVDDVLEDVDISFFNGKYEDSLRILIKFNISSIPAGKVTDAKLFFYRKSENGWSGNVSIYGIDNQTWQEDYDISSLWLLNAQRVNFQQFDGKWKANGWDWVDVTASVIRNRNAANDNASFWLEDPNFNDTIPNNVGNNLLPSYLYLGSSTNINNYTALYSSDDSINTAPYLNVTYDEVPSYSNISTELVNTFTGFGYSNFSVRWDDDSGNLSAYIENNFSGSIVNETMSGDYYYNSTTLAAGTYQFRFVAVDSVGNENATDVQYFTIEKGVPNISLSISPSSIVTYPTETTVIGTENNLGDDNVVYALWRVSELVANNSTFKDVSVLDIGSYFYIFNSSQNQNWTSASVNDTLVVEQAALVTGGVIAGGGTLYVPPPETEEERCTEDWSCLEWSDCIDGSQTRICTDGNECGTEDMKPLESRECSVPEETIQENEKSSEPSGTETAPTGLFLGIETGSIIATLAVSVVIIAVLLFVRSRLKEERNVLESMEEPTFSYEED